MIFSVVGLILMGIATPTESAAFGVLSILILAAAFRLLTWEAVKRSLEGTMRVSVVATGLAIESESLTDDEPAEEQETPARPVFGYTGKQPIPVKKPAPMAPVATAPQIKRAAPAPRPQPVQHHEDEQDELEATQQVIHQARVPATAPRMPAAEDFPPIAQRQIAAQQNRIENIAEHAAKKKRGLFERLAGVGLSRKCDIPQPEPDARARHEPRIQASEPQRPQVAQMPVTGTAQPAGPVRRYSAPWPAGSCPA